MQNLEKPSARREGLVVQEMPEEVLVYDLNTNKAHCLNKSAAAVWKNCNGSNTVSDIAAILKNEFKTSVNEDFVWLAIDQLNKDNLLEQKLATPTSGLSRREALRRVGIASLIALPVVASLVAPKAVQAGSVCAAADPCTCSVPMQPSSNCTGMTTGCAGLGNCVCRNLSTTTVSNTGVCATP